jgi:protein-tyrosine phosphatase
MAEGDLSLYTEVALRARGIDRALTGPTRIKLTEADLQRAHLTIAVKEDEHRLMMHEQFPDWENRITYWTIHDLDCALPEESLPVLEEHVRALAAALAAEHV